MSFTLTMDVVISPVKYVWICNLGSICSSQQLPLTNTHKQLPILNKTIDGGFCFGFTNEIKSKYCQVSL